MRIVLDSAVVALGLFDSGKGGASARVLHNVSVGKLTPCVSVNLLREYYLVFGYHFAVGTLFLTGSLPSPRTRPHTFQNAARQLAWLLARAQVIDTAGVAPPANLPGRPSDAEMVRVAYAGDARYIVTSPKRLPIFSALRTRSGLQCNPIDADGLVRQMGLAWHM